METIGVTGKTDPADEAPWAMPIAFLTDKQEPAHTLAICEAAAMAVVRLLAEPEAVSPTCEAAIARWQDGRIRKVVRRGKSAMYHRTDALPGVTVSHRGATVKAFVPGPTDELASELRKLQVSGTEPARGTSSETGWLTLAFNPALIEQMSAGKKAAQAGHGAQLTFMALGEAERAAWASTGFSVRVVEPSPSEWARLRALARHTVTDAGFTEIAPGSHTVIAVY